MDATDQTPVDNVEGLELFASRGNKRPSIFAMGLRPLNAHSRLLLRKSSVIPGCPPRVSSTTNHPAKPQNAFNSKSEATGCYANAHFRRAKGDCAKATKGYPSLRWVCVG